MVRNARITVRLARRIEMAACAHPVSRAAITFFVDMNAVPSRGQSGNLRLDGNLIALLGEGDVAGRGVALGRFQPRAGGLSERWQRGANGERTDRRDEHQTLHGTSWRTTTNDIGAGKRRNKERDTNPLAFPHHPRKTR